MDICQVILILKKWTLYAPVERTHFITIRSVCYPMFCGRTILMEVYKPSFRHNEFRNTIQLNILKNLINPPRSV